MAPHYTDSLEDTFPLLRQKRQLEEEMASKVAAVDAMHSSAADVDLSVDKEDNKVVVEFMKAEKPKPKKRFMTMSDLPSEDIFGNLKEPASAEIDEADMPIAPFSGVGRRLKDGRPFMYTAFYDGHVLTLCVFAAAMAVIILGFRQLSAISTLKSHIQQLHNTIEKQHREHTKERRGRHYVMAPRFHENTSFV